MVRMTWFAVKETVTPAIRAQDFVEFIRNGIVPMIIITVVPRLFTTHPHSYNNVITMQRSTTDSIQYFSTDEGVDRRNVWKE